MIDKNEKKNENSLRNLKKFDSNYQPSPEAKKQGWNERRARQRLYDILEKYGIATYGQLLDLKADIKKNPHNYTMEDVNAIIYVSNSRNFDSYLDRMGVRAKARIDITSDDEKLELTTINLLSDLLDGITNIRKEGNKGADKDDIQE